MMRTRPDWNSTLGRSPTLDFGADFKFGRTAAANCTPGALPDAQDSCTAVEETFVNAMGLSWEQSAALMGVHTLGRALSHNSGFEGWWSEGPEGRAFSNSYYVSLLAKGWVPQELESGKHQWARGDGGSTLEMMLDSDLCLLFEVTDFNTGETTTASSSADSCCAWADESNEASVASLLYAKTAFLMRTPVASWVRPHATTSLTLRAHPRLNRLSCLQKTRTRGSQCFYPHGDTRHATATPTPTCSTHRRVTA